MFNFFKKSKPPEPKPSLGGIEIKIERIPGAVEIVEGFPRVNWPLVRESLARYSKHSAIDQILTEAAAQWFEVLARHLGDDYQVTESKHVLLLSAQSAGEARRFLEIGDEAYERLAAMVEENLQARGVGKHAVIVLKKNKEYYDYIEHFYAERKGEYGTSSGIHISAGYRHTVINGASATKLRTLVHELAHDAVSGRPLPRWLNEGFAQFAEEMVRIPGYGTGLLDDRQARIQRRYWSWFGMAHFWNGRAFLNSSSQRLSYQLAKILFSNLVNDRVRGRAVGTFLRTADRADAGSSACMQCLGCSLSEMAAEFLGPGDWEPPVSSRLESALEEQGRGTEGDGGEDEEEGEIAGDGG